MSNVPYVKQITFSGNTLRRLRDDRRLTQHDLASALRKRGFGTTQTTVSRWEDGQQPHASVLPALAAELGVSMDALYADDDPEEDAAAVDFGAAMQTLFERAVEAKVEAVVQQVLARIGKVAA